MTKTNTKNDCLRVLYVNTEGAVAGAEQSLMMAVQFMPKTVQMATACPGGPLTDKLKSFNIKTYKILPPPANNIAVMWIFYIAIVNIQLLLIILREKPDIIHANSTKAVLAAVLGRFFAKRKLIWHMRDLKCSRIQAKICSCSASKIIAVSKAVKNKLIQLGVKTDIEVIYNGVNTSSNNNNIDKTIKNISQLQSPPTFANIGQFVPWKNQLTFIEAAEEFLSKGYKAVFLLVGDDIFKRDSKYKQKLLNRVKKSPFASNIKITRWQNDMNLLWPKINCLVHTATAEPFGRVVIEAMTNNVAVIACAVNGPAEIIDNGINGLLFEQDNITQLSTAIETIFNNKQLRQNLIANAREHIWLNFRADKTSEKIASVYEKLTAA